MIKTNNLDKTLLSNISTVKTDIYLLSQGWQKTGEIEGFASTWLLQEKDIELLLPLNKDYADFEARMFEVIYILEKIEKRPSYEIIDVLKDTSKIASHQGREIIEIVLKSVYENKYEINAENFGQVLKTTQKHLFALGDVFGGKSLNKTENTAKSELEISVLSTFHGSFGFRLGFGSQRQLDIENNCISKQVSKSFLNLLRISGEESIGTFRNYISSQEKQISRTFRLFIQSLKTLESDFIFDWGSVGMENEEIARLSYSKVLEVDDALSKVLLNNNKFIYNNMQSSHSGSGDYVAGNKQINKIDAPVAIAGIQGTVIIKDNATVGGVVNQDNSQKLTEIAHKINDLYSYLEQNNNNPPMADAINQVKAITDNYPELNNAEIIQVAIENNPNLKQRLLAASSAVFVETIKVLLPPVGIAIEAIKSYQKPD